MPVNGGKSSSIRSFLRRHPIVSAIALSAILALAGALINWLISYIPGNGPGSINPIPVIQAPGPGEPVNSSPPTPPSSSSSPSHSSTTTRKAIPFSEGSCLAGNFTKSTPHDVHHVQCSSAEAQYKVIKEFPGARSPSVCRGVRGAKIGYLEEYLENGIVVNSYVYCLGNIEL